ncbi:MAG TPA: cell division protein FtsQ/DivIB [Xanthomonadales bacterium]|nr:cell division protein FtsQ/DivIB [Xanthomonadales bacterium]
MTAALRHAPAQAGGGIAMNIAAWLAALALVALPLVGVMNGWFASDRWPFRQLKIDAEFRHVNADQVRAAAAPQLARGFFAVDLGVVRAAIEQVPWVERAEVRKHWPDLLEVRLVEREAVAVWGDHRLVSRTGELFAVPGNTAPEGLPSLGGPDDRVAEVLDFHGRINVALRGSGLQASGLALSPRGGWTAQLANGAEVVIGREQPEQRFARFVAALPRLEPGALAQLARADLRYANGFALRLQEPVAPEPAREPVPAPAPVPAASPLPNSSPAGDPITSVEFRHVEARLPGSVRLVPGSVREARPVRADTA